MSAEREWLVIAPNPWLLAAKARDRGVRDRVEFADSDVVPDDGRVFVINQGALRDFPLTVEPNFTSPQRTDLR